MFKKATLGLVMSFLLFTVGSHIPLSLSASWPTPISGDRGSAIVRTVTEWSGERLAEKGILMSKNCPVGFGATCSPQIAPVPGAVADADILGAGFWAPASPLRAEYIIDCRIDPAKGFLKGTETIRLKNSAEQAISKLIVYRQVREGSSLSISADGKDAIVLQETSYVSQAANYFNGGCPFENYRYTVFDLPEAWQPSKSLDLKVDFSTPIIDANTLYLTEWHPRLYWGYPTHDDFEVKVDLPPGYSLVTSGRFDGKSGRFCANDVRSFGLVFGKNLRVKDASAGDVLVQLLYPPDHEEWAQIVSATAVDAVNFYRQRFGFYPYKNLSIVLGGNFNVGTSISALHDQEFKTKEESENDWKWSTAHEIAHMYWGEYILNREVPTDLSFSTDPVRWCVLSPLMLGMGFRADREYSRARGLVDMKPYHPYEINFRWLIQAFRDCRDSTMSMTAEQQLDIEEWYQNKVLRHGRGSALVSALESLIGSDIFDRVYQRCLRVYGGRRMDTHDLQTECEKETGQDLTWFFDQWLHSNAYPAYEVISKKSTLQGSRYMTEVEVKSVGTLKMPVVVEVLFEDGTRQSSRTDRFLDVSPIRFESASALKDVRLDPQAELPLVTPPYPPNKGAVIKQINTWFAMTWTKDQVGQLLTDAAKLDIHDRACWLSLALGAYKGGWYQEALVAIEGLRLRSPNNLFMVLGMKGLLLDLLGQRKNALECYQEALKSKGDTLESTSLGLLINRQWVEERLKTPFVRK